MGADIFQPRDRNGGLVMDQGDAYDRDPGRLSYNGGMDHLTKNRCKADLRQLGPKESHDC
jgi:hypothetical protein